MKVDADKLIKQLASMPKAVERNLVKSVRLNTEQAANMARRLVPVKSGELRGWIHTLYEADGFQSEYLQFSIQNDINCNLIVQLCRNVLSVL